MMLAKGQLNTMTPQDIKDGFATVDPENKLGNEEKNLKLMHDMFDYWMSKGRPDKAQESIVGIAMYNRQQSVNAGQMAVAAFQAGKPELALKFMQRSYSMIPDGSSLTYQMKPDGSAVSYSFVDIETGERSPEQTISMQDAQAMAAKLAGGQAFFQAMAAKGGGGRGGGGTGIRGRAEGKESQGTQADRDRAQGEADWTVRQREADSAAQAAEQAAAAETDPAKKQALTEAAKEKARSAKYLQQDRGWETNQAKGRANVKDDADALSKIPEGPSQGIVRSLSERLLQGNPNMSPYTAIKLADTLTQKGGAAKLAAEGQRWTMPNYSPFFATWQMVREAAQYAKQREETDKQVQ
jgi:hypothetical protein